MLLGPVCRVQQCFLLLPAGAHIQTKIMACRLGAGTCGEAARLLLLALRGVGAAAAAVSTTLLLLCTQELHA